jgi:preprotein translocase subunit SecG
MQVLNIFHVLVAIALIAFVLVQRGQGATAGAAFGSGASGTVFGARGAGNFLSRSTWVLAALFCTISLTMAVMISRVTATPEQDLGVVGSAVTQPAANEGGQQGEAVLRSAEPDVPAVPVDDGAAAGNAGAQPGAEDLPPVDSAAAASEENAAGSAAAEDLPPAAGGEDDSDKGSGGR